MSGRGQGLDREVCHVGQGTGVRQRSSGLMFVMSGRGQGLDREVVA